MGVKFPQFLVSGQRGPSIIWSGQWRPSELGDTYTLRITYAQGFRPKIAIVSPKLALAEGHNKLPHVYGGGQNDICVHRPEEWNALMLIAETIMPWISQWLYFYEVWALTGKWLGKGTHPSFPEHADGLSKESRRASLS